MSISSNCVLTVINASAAVTLLEQRPEKNSGSERDSNPRLLRCQCSALSRSEPEFFFSGLCSSSVTAALTLMTVSTQLLLMDKINFHPTILGPSITSTFKGLTRIRPLSCGFDSSVGRALHWHLRSRGFESRSELEFFSGLCSSSVTTALALMTVGGLNVLDFETMVKSLRLAWLGRLYTDEDAGWKRYLRFLIKPFGGHLLFHCDYEPREYNITNKFYAELIQFWAEFRNAFSTEDDSTSIIWNNKNIKTSGTYQ